MSTGLNQDHLEALAGRLEEYGRARLASPDVAELLEAERRVRTAAAGWDAAVRAGAALVTRARDDLDAARTRRAAAAVAARAAGTSLGEIGRRLGVSTPRVSQILAGGARAGGGAVPELEEAAEAVEAADARDRAARGVRWLVLQAASAAGTPATELARLSGLSRAGVYKILENDVHCAIADTVAPERAAELVRALQHSPAALDAVLKGAAPAVDDGEAAAVYAHLLLLRGDRARARAIAAQADGRGSAFGAMVHAWALGGDGIVRGATDVSAAAFAAMDRAVERGAGQGRLMLAAMHDAVGRIDEAVEHYRAAAGEGDLDALYRLGLLLDERGEREAAEEAFRNGLARGHAMSGLSLGMRLWRRSRDGDAEPVLRAAVDLGDPWAAVVLADLLRRADRHEEAHDFLSHIRIAETTNASLLESVGEGFFRLGDTARAVDAWRAAADAGSGDAAFSLGAIFVNAGGFADGEKAWRRADELAVARAAVELGYLAMRRGRRDEAAAVFERAAAGGDLDAVVALGALAEERGDRSHAETLYRAADDQGHALGANRLGSLLAERGDEEGRARRSWAPPSAATRRPRSTSDWSAPTAATSPPARPTGRPPTSGATPGPPTGEGCSTSVGGSSSAPTSATRGRLSASIQWSPTTRARCARHEATSPAPSGPTRRRRRSVTCARKSRSA